MKYGFCNMKKIIKNTAIFAGLFSLFSSCQVGLGNAVDLQAPVIELTSHRDNDSVPENFTLTGTASDNEGVTLLTIDFADADIHYQIIPGANWYKKTSASDQWIVVPESTGNFCKNSEKGWSWSVEVETADRTASKTDTTYSFTALVKDKAGNSGKNSKLDCSLIVDTESPDVSIQQPELLTGTHSSVKSDTDTYELKNGNFIAKLLNGEIAISGRIDQSISFKGLRIDFDNGENQSGKRKSTKDSTTAVNSLDDVINLSDASLEDESEAKIYCTKILSGSELNKTWTLKITPEDLINSENGKADHLETGKHLIRVVSTCLSASNAWERKILGYFVWWPEADTPWITVNSCDEEDYDEENPLKSTCYPGSNISGSCQDDDGIKGFIATVYKKENGEYVQKSQNKPIDPDKPKSEILKYLAFAVEVPAENGSYKVDFKVIDINGNESSLTKYFKTSDVSAPKIEILSPEEHSSVIQNVDGNVTFKVKATDDGSVKKLAVVWLNPAQASNVQNKINYLTGSADYWDKATETGSTDENGNKLYLLKENGTKEETVEKTFNLYSDLGIDGKTKKLAAQEFIFYASDGTSNSIETITLTGDTSTPSLSFVDISIEDQKNLSLADPENLPTFKKLKSASSKATITGTWSDSFKSDLKNTDKFSEFSVKWGDNSATITKDYNGPGTWKAEVTPPKTGGTITAVLSDYAGNTRTIQSAASIESTDLSLARVGCNEDDGAYTTGKVLNLTLEFTKNTDVDITGGTPTLTLNNGGTASYVSGSGTPVHVYSYTVAAADRDVPKLAADTLNANGAKWYDSAVEKNETNKVIFTLTDNVSNLNSTRTITIDKTKPAINSITSLVASGYYKQGAQIPLMLEFSEDVTIAGVSDSSLYVNFAHNSAKTTSTSVSGSKYVLFTYVVGAGDNADTLTFSSISHSSSVTVEDNAGNVLENWTPAAKSFAGVVIDTAKPSAPSFGSWDPLPYITDASGTSFTLTGEADAAIEYSIDNGASWIPYTGKVTLKNNKEDYNVTARQTDVAGNISSNADVKSFAIDAGDLLTKITANTPSGTYSLSTSTKKITGRIEFRKSVKLPGDSKVTLNVKNSSGTYYQCPIKETSGSVFTFEYAISEGDYIDNNAELDVTDFSFDSVTVDVKGVGKSVSIENSSFGTKSFGTNRDIYILTGKPVLQTASITGTTLNVKYDRSISKLSGNIVLEYDDKTGNEFRVPIVLTASEYNELKSNTTIRDSYAAGTNGANVSGSTLVNDTTTKYILKTTVSDTDSTLKDAFKAANKHKVTIPIIAGEVSVTDNDTLTVDMSGTYKVPVKGAVYKLTIPANAVTDEVNNKNDESTDKTVTATGVEKPEIRIKKPVYAITIPAGSTTNLARTKNATVNINDMETATMYLNCRTPGASIKYKTTILESTRKIVNSNPIIKCESPQNTGTSGREEIAALRYKDGEFTTLTAGASIPQATETYTTPVTLKGTKDVSSYGNANGLKIAIAAQASVGTSKSDLSYEYATRTVVKFMISNYRDNNGGTVVEGTGDNTVYMRNLRMWLTGGDGTSGSNSNENTPISWTDTSKFMLMAGTKTIPNSTTAFSEMYGNWWWVTWDITDATYIGFVAGNVPSDGATMGPDKWYCADYHWTTIKEQYPLYPGETLVMMAHGTQNEYVNAKFFWDNTEKLWYYSPYYAKFGFETKKAYSRSH